MKHYLKPLALFLAVSLVAACKKKTAPEPVIPTPPVKTVTGTYTIPSPASYTFTEEHTYAYNISGQLVKSIQKTFVGDNGNLRYDNTDHEYTNGRLIKTTSSVSGVIGFTYNENGQIVKQNKDLGGPISDLITYNANGSIAKLVIASVPARDDPWTCVYNYSADGLLANIVITPKMDPNSAGTIYFSGYTDECDFDPLVMDELMDLFVFFPPLAMKGWKRLPQQVNYVFADESGGNNHSYTYTIKDRKIEKMTRVRIYPDQSNNVRYNYTFAY